MFFFVLSREWNKEKILSPHEEFLMRTQNFFFVPLSWQDKKNIFLYFFTFIYKICSCFVL